MRKVLPILFNTDMVQAILDGRKTATRRAVKYKYSNTEMKLRTDKYGTRLIEIQKDIEGETHGKNPDGGTWHKLLPYIEKKSPCKKGDILYVRETWAFIPCIGCNGDYIRAGAPMNCYDYQAVEYDDGNNISDGCFVYRTDYGDTEDDSFPPSTFKWRPSIHMPKQAARIWLKVMDVRVERLQEMNTGDFLEEGVVIRPEAYNDPENAYQQAKTEFIRIWNSTIKKQDMEMYGWDTSPWVWVIEFKRCEKPDEDKCQR